MILKISIKKIKLLNKKHEKIGIDDKFKLDLLMIINIKLNIIVNIKILIIYNFILIDNFKK